MKTYAVTMKAYRTQQVRYIEANSKTEARSRANGMSSIAYVVSIREIPTPNGNTKNEGEEK